MKTYTIYYERDCPLLGASVTTETIEASDISEATSHAIALIEPGERVSSIEEEIAA